MKKLFLIAALLTSSSAFAQTDITAPITPPVPAAAKDSTQPIEITALKSVEWLRNDKKYIARDNVIIKQGATTITSDLATADYREGKTSSMQIWQLVAEGNVSITSDNNVATGDKAVYDVDNALATLTGSNLKITSPDQVVTARDRIEYYSNTRRAKAIGNAKVVRGTDTLTASTITATFKDKGNAAAKPEAKDSSPIGGSSLDTLEADGNVVIVTPSETLRGSHGIYRADSNTAEITGKVKIERGQNILEGDRAEVNLTTNVSKMFGSEKTGGRVRGVFFPGSEQKPGAKPETAKPAAKQPPKAPVAARVPATAPTAPEMFPGANSSSAAPSSPAKVAP